METKSKLILVGTPIGNLGDFSPRALQALQTCDFIAAEDTRVTIKLLNYFNIKKPMISYFEHNKQWRGEQILKRIEQNETCVLVTDAGMPAISDPGEQLVTMCAEKNIPVSVIPGPCALISALSVSGLSTGRFTFEGFLSMNKKNRKAHLQSLKNETRTMVFYEAPHKLLNTLEDLYKNFGERQITLVREITKLHEEILRTTLTQSIKTLKANPLKGEFVLVLQGANIVHEEKIYNLEEAVIIAKNFIKQGQSVSAAAKNASSTTKIKKQEIYKVII